jgi:cysteine synthase
MIAHPKTQAGSAPRRLAETLRLKSMPAVHPIGDNLFAACFWLMKLCVGMKMVEDAVRRGKVGDGGLVVESTSGTMGYGLALAGRAFGLRVHLVGDPAIDPLLSNLLDQLGAEIDIVTEKLDVGGYQVPRLRRVQWVLAQRPEALWVQQYDNPSNPLAYAVPAETIAAKVGRVDILVATTGSGGSVSGTARALRALGMSPRVIAVDTHNSVLFGHPDGPRQLRGLGNSIHPKNLDYSLIDEVHWVGAADAFAATRELFTDFGLDMGPTTGAAFHVARWAAKTNPGKSVVFIGPDRAERYLSTVYDPTWCRTNGVWIDKPASTPYQVDAPAQARGGWARLEWGRRTLEQVKLDDHF